MLPPPPMPYPPYPQYQQVENPLHAVHQAYGVWDSVMKEDPSGSAVRSLTHGAVISAVIFGVLGAVIPTFTVKEGLKWGALVGGARGVYMWYSRKGEGTGP